MAFDITEIEAGNRLLEEDVKRAESALTVARGRRDRKAAEQRLQTAKSALAAGQVGLAKERKRLEALRMATATPILHHQDSAPKMPLDRARQMIESFLDARSQDGDRFGTAGTGNYWYSTGGVCTGISIYGRPDSYTIDVYACARSGVRPSIELYRQVSRWRYTIRLGYPHVVELDDGRAAVLCQEEFRGGKLHEDDTAIALTTATIDIVSQMSKELADDLADHGGYRIEEEVHGDMRSAYNELFWWWSIRDDRLATHMGIS